MVAACVGDATGRANWWNNIPSARSQGSRRGRGVVPAVRDRTLAPRKQPAHVSPRIFLLSTDDIDVDARKRSGDDCCHRRRAGNLQERQA